MKKRLKSILICLLIILLALAVLAIRNGVSINGFFNLYPGGSYQSGDAAVSADGIRKIEIEWISGNVEIREGDGPDIVFSETCDQELSEKDRLHYRVDGSALIITPHGSGFTFSLPSKDLTVTLPKGYEADRLKIGTVSADTVVSGIRIGELEVSGTSGNLNAAVTVRDLKVETVSGGTTVTAEGIRKADVETVSGNVDLIFSDSPSEIKLHSVSGDAEITLPAATEFTLKMDTVSGDTDIGFAVTRNKNEYICGDGENSYRFESVSGDLRLIAK